MGKRPSCGKKVFRTKKIYLYTGIEDREDSLPRAGAGRSLFSLFRSDFAIKRQIE